MPIPDRPDPPPATITKLNTSPQGGGGGSPFSYSIDSTSFNAIKFLIRCSAYIDNIQLLLGDGVGQAYTPAFGGGGGNHFEWAVPAGQYISQV